MKRRDFIGAALGASLAAPAVAQKTKPLIFVPQANLTSLDPVWTTATVTRNFALMVYETLYGRDQAFRPGPQMVAGHVISDDGKRWTMTLRDGLVWHDGEKVLARDCVASLQRWLKRDAVAPLFEERVDAIEAADDKTLVWRLKKPFPLLAHFLSKVQPTPVMMPERIAAGTDPYKQVSEIVGCGPFRFHKDEYVSGSFAAFSKFDRYVPRPEPVSYLTGGRHVKLDRVEWKIIPDPATAANALTSGEVDWVELPQPDLIPMLKRANGVTTGLLDLFGVMAILRPNHAVGPTANAALRRAMLAAIDQKECMLAAMGEDPTAWRAPMGFFLPGSQAASEAGMEAVRVRKSNAELRKMVEASGYKGERIVVMHPTDQVVYNAFVTVAIDALRKIGLNLDVQTVDWGTIVQRRNSKAELDKGGWSLFPAGAPAPEYSDPLLANLLRASGPKAWIGWPDDPRLETAFSAWIDATSDNERRALEVDMQRAAFDSVPFIPCGQYLPHAAWRKNVTGLLQGSAPVFWGAEKV